MESFRTVVSAKVEVVTGGGQLFLVDKKILGLRSDDDIDRYASLVQPFSLRVDRSGADTAGDEYVPLAFQLLIRLVNEGGRVAQRSHDIAEELAFGLGDDRGR